MNIPVTTFGIVLACGIYMIIKGARSFHINNKNLTVYKALKQTTYVLQKAELLEGHIRLNLVTIAYGIILVGGSMVMIIVNL